MLVKRRPRKIINNHLICCKNTTGGKNKASGIDRMEKMIEMKREKG